MEHTFRPELWMCLPFAVLLVSIAITPLIAPHFWEKNRNKFILTFLISLPPLGGLLMVVPHELAHSMIEYLQFLTLMGSLFVVSGGISLTGDLKGTPLVNSAFLLVGAVLANIAGTTGASMLLIRPFLKTNSERHHVVHHVPFFIFIVSNIGGLLTPIGDPPLFLGYLRGVPFFWTFRLFPFWLLCIGFLIAVFYLLDRRAYRRETNPDLNRDKTQIKPLRIDGRRNLLLLAGILYGVFLPTPWREIVMVHMALISLWVTPKHVHQHNHFSWHPIQEIAILFAGIFITMVPALILLNQHGPEYGITDSWHFFWMTGGLSGFLDNAPTYLTFFSMARGLGLPNEVAGMPHHLLEAISLGSVLMGANTYIGNGPNFMVKSIADERGTQTPSFFGYIGWAVACLFPLYGIITIILMILH